MTIPTLQDFLNDVKNHELIIHKDDGIYRHITLRDPKTINLLFNITTFPDYLVITGDMGTLTFSRVNDMFKFFRNDELNINPNYWAEKIQAIEYKAKKSSYSEFDITKAIESFKEMIDEQIADNNYTEEFIEELTDAFHCQIADCSDEYEFVEAVRGFEVDGYDTSDIWESLSYTSYLYRYIWLCYAIVWGIKQYDSAKELRNNHE